MPTLGGKLRILGRKTMKPRFPTILPESLHYSGTIPSLFGGGGRNRTSLPLIQRQNATFFWQIKLTLLLLAQTGFNSVGVRFGVRETRSLKRQ